MAHALAFYLVYMLPALLGTTMMVRRAIKMTHEALDLADRLGSVAGRGDTTDCHRRP